MAGALAKSSLEDEWVGEFSDGLKADLNTRVGAVSKSVREASDTLKAEFEDAGAEYGDRVKQAAGMRWRQPERKQDRKKHSVIAALASPAEETPFGASSEDVHAVPVLDRADLAPKS
jgi:hypothetical protein